MTDPSTSSAAESGAFRDRLFGVGRSRHRPESRASDFEETPNSNKSPSAVLGTAGVPDEIASANIWKSRWDRAPVYWKRFVSTLPKEYGLTDTQRSLIQSRNTTYVHTAPLTTRAWLGTGMVATIVGTFSKFLLGNLNRLHTYNLSWLHAAIENRRPGRGLLTVSNHQSVLDDPFLMGAILPSRILFDAIRMRWGLCALDICFQDEKASRVLRLGKALPIERGGGLSQPFLLDAGEKLASGDWVHVFPEGRVRQIGMGYSKRGVGKMMAMAYEAQQGLPLVIPFYHEGMEKVMPHRLEDQKLESMTPRTDKDLFVMVGEPLDFTPIFDTFMPACEAAGGSQTDAPPCLKLYEEVADFLAVTMRLLRAEAREKIRDDLGADLGEPYELS